jgi:SAM-dependent methyltransferase
VVSTSAVAKPALRLSVRSRLFLSSALMLTLELVLIRWTAANVVHLGYFSNIVLLGSFLGVSLGFLRVRRSTGPPWYFLLALGLFAVVITVVPVSVDRSGSDLVFFTSLQLTGPPPWVVLPTIFAAVALIMAGPGELVGRYLGDLPRLEAYRLDLLGSLAGIAVFSLLAFLRAPSLVWGLLVCALSLVLLTADGVPPVRVAWVPLLGMALLLAVLSVETLTPRVSWSPYNKIQLVEQTTPAGAHAQVVLANGIPHQSFYPVQERITEDDLYGVLYERIPPPPPEGRSVLIIGAGTGNDVALALQRGARSVHAVEIDPRIEQIGAELNTDRPYADPRVHVTIDDGRAVLQNDPRKYDLVIFALPDSLTLVSGASQIRLESYLFTEQAIEAARNRLTPGGSLALYNYYREDWLVGRLVGTLRDAFGHDPCVDATLRARAVLTISRDAAAQRCAGPMPAAFTHAPPPVQDDRPFLYLNGRGIPGIYLSVLFGVLAISLLAVRAVAGPLRRMRPYADLFALGAAFLLLETRAVSGFALLFGTTWFVNALVFAGVLLAVLAAVETTRRLPRPPSLPVAYAALAASLLVALAVPAARLLALPVPARAAVAITLTFLPVFTANVVFAQRFRVSGDAATALGANLLGAIVGGCLEYLALVIGYHALIGVAGALYLAAFLIGRTRES